MLPVDKLKHLMVGAAITAFCTLALGLMPGAPVGALLTLLAAIGRELYNQHNGGLFDVADLAATCVGSVPGFLLAWLLIWSGGGT